MAGKTGTAQVIGIAQNTVYKEEEVSERHRHHGLFIAFAPVENPTIAVGIIVENGGGSSAASPIAREVIDVWLLGDQESELAVSAAVVTATAVTATTAVPESAASVGVPQ